MFYGVSSNGQRVMTTYWRMGGIDWNNTMVFSLLTDLQGYIRINLKGREKEGIVEEEDYQKICSKIIDSLKSLKDSETNEPVVETIKRRDELFTEGNGFNNLPDIIVNGLKNQHRVTNKLYLINLVKLNGRCPGKILMGEAVIIALKDPCSLQEKI